MPMLKAETCVRPKPRVQCENGTDERPNRGKEGHYLGALFPDPWDLLIISGGGSAVSPSPAWAWPRSQVTSPQSPTCAPAVCSVPARIFGDARTKKPLDRS